MNDGGVGLIPIADALQVPLVVESGKVKGFRSRKMRLGGWVLERPIKVEHDFVGDGKSGVFCNISGDLWAYVLSSPDVLVCLLLDGSKLYSAFGGRSFEVSIKQIKPAIVAAFAFNSDSKRWERDECARVVDRFRATGTPGVQAATHPGA